MSKADTTAQIRMVAQEVPGYEYDSPAIAQSPVTVSDFESMKQAAGFTDEDERWLRVAGDVLREQAKELVTKWRDIIGSLPQLARYSQSRDGQKLPSYSERSGLRLQQWVLDTCFRPYDQDWLNYQHEIALRHTSAKKNRTDGADSAPTIHLRYIIAFGPRMIDPAILKPFLSAKGHSAEQVDHMLQAWMKSMWLQIALWSEVYVDRARPANEW